jgi:hypothetical protein
MDQLSKMLFQKLDFDDLRELVKWAREEGWNPGPHDADVYWATDPDGYYGYYKEGELIAVVRLFLMPMNSNYGFFIVNPNTDLWA